MFRKRRLPALRALISLYLALLGLTAQTAAAQDYVINNVSVISVAEGVVHSDQQVVIRDGVIEAIGARDSVLAPAELQQIDGERGFLMPGLAEMHAHVPRQIRGEQHTRDVLMLYLANGITTIRGMLGEPWHLELRELLASGEWLGPRLVTSGPSFNGRSVSSPEQVSRLVAEQAKAGYDFLKLHPGLKRDEYRAIVESAQTHGVPYAGHISTDVGLALTLESAQATIDHLDGYAQALVPDGHALHGVAPDFFGINLASGMQSSRAGQLALATAEAGVWNVPTQSLLENLLYTQSMDALMSRAEMVYVSDALRRDWQRRVSELRESVSRKDAARFLEARRVLIVELQQQGAGLLLGSDAPQMMNVPGFSLHEELAYLVNAGLSPLQALQSGTVNVGRFLQDETHGVMKIGSPADLVLLKDNPLDDIANTRDVRGVMRQGRWLDRAALDKVLAGIRERKI